MKVLIVEPSRFSGTVITQTLQSHGLFADCVSTGEEARTQIDQEEYQVICIAETIGLDDLGSVCSYLRVKSDTELTPIIVLTSSDESDTESYMALGVTEIFDTKEVRLLGHHIEKMCGKFIDATHSAGKILFVEDSRTAAKIVINQLTKDNHQITHFTTAEEAIDDYEHGRYDLVLTDVVLLGKIDGIELVRHIRENEDTDMIPVSILAMSGYTDPTRTLSLLQAGANDYVPKPIIGEELRARVNNLILNQHLLRRLQVQQERLEQLAMTDQLTGLFNRHYLQHVVQKTISSAIRHDIDLCLMVIDVDHFKKVNDEHGHTIGDVVLTHISGLLSTTARNEDIVARYGGEEFVIVLDHCSLDAALEKAEFLRTGIEQLRPEDLTVTASFGVTQYRKEDGEDFNSFFARADVAVYRAKSRGRNCVVASD
jgi:two-component system cell cycle response regulator